jgi:hypothetical protein
VLGKRRRRNEATKKREELGTRFAWNVEMIMIGYMHLRYFVADRSISEKN